MGGSSSSTSDFLLFHVMTDVSFFLYKKRKCTKREGQKKLGHQVVHLLQEDLYCTLEIDNCSSLQAVSTMAGCHTI
jgi:hypothetical protein